MSCISRSDVTQCATLELDKCLFQAPPPPPNERLDESSVRKPDRNIRLSQHQIVEAHESYTRGDSAPVCSMAARDAEVGRVYWGCYQHLASDTGTAAAAAAAAAATTSEASAAEGVGVLLLLPAKLSSRSITSFSITTDLPLPPHLQTTLQDVCSTTWTREVFDKYGCVLLEISGILLCTRHCCPYLHVSAFADLRRDRVSYVRHIFFFSLWSDVGLLIAFSLAHFNQSHTRR